MIAGSGSVDMDDAPPAASAMAMAMCRAVASPLWCWRVLGGQARRLNGYTSRMFTGIITAMGRIVSLTANDFGVRLVINPGKPAEPPAWPALPSAGDSVAVQGCCLTLAPKAGDPPGCLGFDLIRETLEKTSLGRRSVGDRVNLELSLTPVTAMGGHFVQGHIDGTGGKELLHHMFIGLRIEVIEVGFDVHDLFGAVGIRF